MAHDRRGADSQGAGLRNHACRSHALRCRRLLSAVVPPATPLVPRPPAWPQPMRRFIHAGTPAQASWTASTPASAHAGTPASRVLSSSTVPSADAARDLVEKSAQITIRLARLLTAHPRSLKPSVTGQYPRNASPSERAATFVQCVVRVRVPACSRATTPGSCCLASPQVTSPPLQHPGAKNNGSAGAGDAAGTGRAVSDDAEHVRLRHRGDEINERSGRGASSKNPTAGPQKRSAPGGGRVDHRQLKLPFRLGTLCQEVHN